MKSFFIGIFWLIVFFIVFSMFNSLIDHATTTPEQKAAKAEREQQALADRTRKGFHCLSDWDGSSRSVIRVVKQRLKDPESFEHIKTRITPVNDKGNHLVYMDYRAKNSFGGYVVDTAVATISNSCNNVSLVVTE